MIGILSGLGLLRSYDQNVSEGVNLTDFVFLLYRNGNKNVAQHEVDCDSEATQDHVIKKLIQTVISTNMQEHRVRESQYDQSRHDTEKVYVALVYFESFSELNLADSLVFNWELNHVARFQHHEQEKNVHNSVRDNDCGVEGAIIIAFYQWNGRITSFGQHSDANHSYGEVNEANGEAKSKP